jgi:hypothetical protein
MMHGHEKSDPAIVTKKPTNKAGQPASEPVERSAGAEGNADQQSTRRAQDRESVSLVVVERNGGKPYRLVPLRAARVPHDEEPATARRAHYQQRVGLGSCAPPQLDSLRRDQACTDRTDPVIVARWASIRHRLRPDRHRQRRDPHGTKTRHEVVCRPAARSRQKRAST